MPFCSSQRDLTLVLMASIMSRVLRMAARVGRSELRHHSMEVCNKGGEAPYFSAFANATESLPFQKGTRARW